MVSQIVISPSFNKRIERKMVENMRLKISKSLKAKAKLIKKAMLRDFLALDITKEIMAGPRSENISGTIVGDGNLFSFIGFRRGEDPIQPILNILEQIELDVESYENILKLKALEFPHPEEIWAVTPMPWQEGRSWARGIESGISGLNYYLFISAGYFPNSRSGTGVQMRKPIRSGTRFKNTQYVSEFLKKYRKIYESLCKTILESHK